MRTIEEWEEVLFKQGSSGEMCFDMLKDWKAQLTAATDEDSPNDLREQGWMVACHNDYRIANKRMTFWLFTKGNECVSGEGDTDADALNEVRMRLKQQAVTDEAHKRLKQPSQIEAEFKQWYEKNLVQLSGFPVRKVAWLSWLASYNNETKEIKQGLRIVMDSEKVL